MQFGFFGQLSVPAYCQLLSLVAGHIWYHSHFALASSSTLLKWAGDSPVWGVTLPLTGQSAEEKMCSCTSMITHIFFTIFWYASDWNALPLD